MRSVKNTTFMAVCGLMAATTLLGCSKKDTETHANEAPVIDVAEAVERPVTLYHTYPGKIHAISTIDLVARVPGYLKAQHYRGGDLVEKGQLLFTIEDTSYRNAVEQAQSQLKTAESQLSYNTTHYEAVKKAAAANAASQMEVEQSRSAMEQSRSAVNTARAALSTAQTNLQYCYVRAPFKGHVSASGPGVGAYLSGGGETLATIYDDIKVRADFYVDDSGFMQMIDSGDGTLHLNQDSIPITFGEKLPHAYMGTLSYISPQVDPNTGTIQLRAMIDNPYDELHAGMYASVKLPYATDVKAVLVNDASISTDQRGKYLYTVSDSNRVVYSPIEVGDVVDDSLRIVTSGIKPGQRYVTKALLKVRPDMAIRPRMPDSK